MRSKVTVVLLFLNVVLFYYIFQYEQRWRAERAQLEARRRVLGPETATIERFTRTSPTAPTLAAEKRGDTWWLTQPIEWPANPNGIARVLSELQLLEHQTSFAVADLAKGGQSLADYGLVAPAMTFTFTAAADYALRLGDRTEIGNRLYVLSPDGSRVHVVAREVADHLGLEAAQLRSDSVFTIPVFEVRSLAVQTAPPANLKIRLRREGPRWGFETPILARADKVRVEHAASALHALQVRRFVEARDADAGRTGLETPQLRVTLEGNARRETLLLGAPVDPTAAADGAPVELFARFEEKAAVFVTAVSPSLLADLRGAQENFRDARVLDFDPAAATAVTLAAPGRPELNLQRLDRRDGPASWQLVIRSGGGQVPATLPADTGVVGELLQQLQGLTATAFASDAPTAADLENFGFNRPELVVTLSLSSGGGPRGTDPTSLVLEVGAKPGERSIVHARLAGSPFVYRVEPAVLEEVPVEARPFRQRLLRELPEGTRITSVTLTDLADGREILRKSAPSDAALTAETIGAGEPAARQAALASLLQQLRVLRAKAIHTESFSPEGAVFEGTPVPWRYRLDLELSLTGGSAQTVTSRLFATARLGGTVQYGGTDELFGGLTVELAQELVDALFALTYAAEHDPGPPDPAKRD
jgi:hypothetical protein